MRAGPFRLGTAAALRQQLRTAIGVSPGVYRRMYRGPRPSSPHGWDTGTRDRRADHTHYSC
jgi:hypothetical protein